MEHHAPSDTQTVERPVDVNGVTIATAISGQDDAPAVLLINGGGNTLASWSDALVGRLVDGGYRVIRYDGRDTGGSTRFPAGAPGYSGEALVADAAGLIDEVAGGRAHVVGLSMGGGIAQLLAVGSPGRVRTLTLVATTGFHFGETHPHLPGPEPRVRAAWADDSVPDWTDREATITWLAESERPFAGTMERFDVEEQRAVAAKTYDRSPDLTTLFNSFMLDPSPARSSTIGDIAVPTLVIHGTADPAFPLPYGQALAEGIPGATLLPVEGMGHEYLPPWTHDVVIPALLGHFRNR
ncbi:MAG TPA: alpha/beta fold hydrolase [Thermomicrobiales bacterium]|nr:alpha/beta fold hydrolase [Thermomicrobiales bacterium]